MKSREICRGEVRRLWGRTVMKREHVHKKAIEQKLCRTFCSFYKWDKDDELACLGFRVIERLLSERREVLFDVPSCMPGPGAREMLVVRLCPKCPYHASDCDFAAKVQDARPCGGFVVLGHLLERGDLSVDDIRDMQ
jgi:hypothetical protein